MKMVRILTLALAILLAIAPAAMADGSLDAIVAKGELVMGLDDSFPPMGFVNEDNEIVGFDVDVAREVCARLGVALKLQPIKWDAKDLELSSGNIDCIWNGMSITPDRQASMALSAAYMKNQIVLVILKGSYASKAELAGKAVGVQAGSFGQEVLDDPANAEFRATLSEVLSYENYPTALLDLKNGNTQAVAMDRIVAGYLIAQGDDALDVIEPLADDLFAVGFRKEDVALRDKVDAILAELAADGTLAELSIKWMSEDLTVIGKNE
ncbi:MAG: amino acid ABC transporter substrate-binding protein [Clostridiales bacterium]|nr:amino acid ABC transporter substrate-binding protein [Clostridiales bacterium]